MKPEETCPPTAVDEPDELDVPDPPEPSAAEISRRRLLGRITICLGVGCGAAISAPGVGFLVAPLLRKTPREWRAVGKVASFKVGDTVNVTFEDASPLPWAGVTDKTAAWLRRESESEFIAFSVNCAHLGCPVRWEADAELFLCPCHGGVYYADGRVAAGPPPHGLTRYDVRVDGEDVQILTGPIPIS
jgi:menaquinol-cytochrome c reductase iron-sulfur subunit